MPGRDPTQRSRDRTRSAFFLTAVATLLWVALAAWAVASPVGASPDDDYHLAMLYCAAGEAECTREGTRTGPCFTMRPDVPASCADYASLQTPPTEGIIRGHYPPLYYAVMSNLIGPTVGATVLTIRLVNVTLAVLIAGVGSMLLTSRALRPAVTVGWLVASVPLGMYFLASINPTAWAVIGLGALWGPLASFLTDAHSARQPESAGVRRLAAFRVLFVAAAAFMALGSRSESALWLPLIALAVALLAIPWPLTSPRAWRADRIGLRLLLPAGLLVASLAALLIFGQAKADRLASTASSPLGSGEPYRGWQVIEQTFNSFAGTLGLPGVPGSGLGTYDVPIPAIGAFASVLALGAVITLGVGTLYPRKVASLVFLLGTSVTITAFLWSRRDWEYYQPRYFLPLTVVMVGLVLVPRLLAGQRDRQPDGAPSTEAPVVPPAVETTPAGIGAANNSDGAGETRLQFALILAAVAFANAVALASTLLRFLRGVVFQTSRDPLTQDAPVVRPGELLRVEVPEWWLVGGLTPGDVWLLGSVSFALALTLVWVAFDGLRGSVSAVPARITP